MTMASREAVDVQSLVRVAHFSSIQTRSITSLVWTGSVSVRPGGIQVIHTSASDPQLDIDSMLLSHYDPIRLEIAQIANAFIS